MVAQSNVNALIDMKLGKYNNLLEESVVYCKEIFDGTLRFDRQESEVNKTHSMQEMQASLIFIGFSSIFFWGIP